MTYYIPVDAISNHRQFRMSQTETGEISSFVFQFLILRCQEMLHILYLHMHLNLINSRVLWSRSSLWFLRNARVRDNWFYPVYLILGLHEGRVTLVPGGNSLFFLQRHKKQETIINNAILTQLCSQYQEMIMQEH